MDSEHDTRTMIADALRLSAHVIAEDLSQLPCQMIGRLGHFSTDALRGLVAQVAHSTHWEWLRPIKATLNPAQGPMLRTLEGHSKPVTGVAITPDGRRGLSSSWDETIKVWDLERGELLHTLKRPSGWTRLGVFTGVAVTADGRRCITSSGDKTVLVWDLERCRAHWRRFLTLAGPTVWASAFPEWQKRVRTCHFGFRSRAAGRNVHSIDKGPYRLYWE